MKLTKRMQNALIQWLILNSIILMIFIWVFFWKVYPNIQIYEEKKQELQDLAISFQELQTTGISFDQFKDSLAQLGLLQDSYISGILQNIDAVFFQKHFQNTEGWSYEEFLKKQETALVALKNSPEYTEKNIMIDTILPFYTGNKNSPTESLNDVSFINYVESILYNFNLESTGDIGVGELEKVESLHSHDMQQIPSDVPQKSPLQEDIYRIPLSFEITGRKSDVLDFLHFFENVGTIQQNENDISVYSDKVLSQILTDKITPQNYNIYKNQIGTIEEIQLLQYPDSSNFANQGAYTNLIDTIRSQQGRDAYTVHIVLHFYISWLPIYKIEENFKKIQDEIIGLMQKAEESKANISQSWNQNISQISQNLSFLQSLISTLQALQAEVSMMQSTLLTQDIPADIYEKVSQYQKQLLNIQNLYNSKFINISVK